MSSAIKPAIIEGNDDLELNVHDHLISQPLAIIGIRWIGKSYEAGKMCEQLCEIQQPFIVIDPEGEYWTLKERYPVIVAAVGKPVGRPKGYKADLSLTSETAPVLAKRIAEKGYTVVLDLRNATMAESYAVLGNFLESLYEAEGKYNRPLVLFMEEAHVLVPEIGRVRLRDIKKQQDRVIYWTYEIAARGRHRGLGYVCIARRAAEVAKAVLSQCPTRFIFKLVDPADLAWLRESGFAKEEIEEIQRLPKGTAYVRGLTTEHLKVRSKERLCTHGGKTPIAQAVETPELESAVADLSELIKAPPTPPKAPDEITKKIAVLEAERDRLKERINSIKKAHQEEVSNLNNKLSTLKEENLKLEARVQELEAEKKHAWDIELESRVANLTQHIKDLEAQLADAEKLEAELEGFRELWQTWKELLIETGERLGLDLIPKDVKELQEKCQTLEAELNRYKTDEQMKREVIEETLHDQAVRSWINDAQRFLGELARRSGAFPLVFKAAIRMDQETTFLPEELQTNVTAQTNLNYLNSLESKGLLWEAKKQGRKAFRNRFHHWVTENIRKIKPAAPDEAVQIIHDQLKNFVLR